jgi:hypothetical protein
MLILLLLFLLLFLGLVIYAIFKFVKWTSQDIIRIKWAISILLILIFGFTIKKLFFTKMEFIQSNVYSNLYIIENPEKDSLQVKKAILNKIKEHLKAKHKQEKKLSYSNETECVYFYEDAGMAFGFIGEAGTSYFIDHEEDLGGFVTEELGMYQNFRMAEFYYNLPKNEANEICGELNFFYEGDFIKADTICNLKIKH